MSPPSPGPMRARVSVRGRDEADARAELYEILLWPAPVTPARGSAQGDRPARAPAARGAGAAPVVRTEAAYR
jgi:hypothetical protein